MFSSFVFDSHDHLISTFNPAEHCLNANHKYLIKSSFNLLIASCSWWYPTLLFALFLPSNSLLQIVLNLFHILQPFKTWSPQVTSQMRRKAFAFMSLHTCNTSASVSSQACFHLLNCCVIAAGAVSCHLCTKHQVSTKDQFHMNSWSAP